ncbi:MAG TPA: hypothetical protein DCY88_23475 [Cyanobacteria bacterium UBA11372]|nr:hypothetical protein [Cyanobacteria bacterium UBA11372]
MPDLELETFEVNYLQSSPGFLIRPIEPPPQGLSKDSPLDGDWLAKEFTVNGVPLLLPTIADLPMECPWGKTGEILSAFPTSVRLIIASIDVEKFAQISEEIAQMTGINPQPSHTTSKAALSTHLQINHPENQPNSWFWVIKTIPISSFIRD